MKPTMTTRRDFIRILGSTGVIAAAGGSLAACSAVPDSANAPWREAGRAESDVRKRALSYALLAPNPHNRQPWIVDLTQPEEIVLYCDRERLLPETDPYSRQILIGHGCFLEVLSIAANRFGQRAEIVPFPEGEFPAEGIDDRPVARVRLTPDANAAPDPLFAQVTRRRSTKEPYDLSKPVSAGALDKLQAALTRGDGMRLVTTNDTATVSGLRDLIWGGMKLEMTTPRTYLESVRLMRIGRAEIAANPDGIDLGGTMIEVGRLFGIVSRESLADPTSSAFQQGLDMQREIAEATPAFGWLIASGNGRSDQLAAGRAYVRLNLKATELGLALHPWSQLLQEYPEMKSLQKAFFRLSGQKSGERTQMLFRLGYGPTVEPSPRRPLAALVKA